MTGYQYLKNRLDEIGSHGRRCWLFRWRHWSVCFVKEKSDER